MAGKTITQRIGLEGGQEVRSQLEAIGKAGQTAFRKFQEAGAAQTIMNRFSGTIDSIKAKAAEMGAAARRLGSDFNNLGERVGTSARNMALIGTVVIGIVAAFGKLVLGAGEAADKLRETAEQVGLTVRQLSNLQFAAQQSSIGADQFVKALTRLNDGMDKAKDQAEALQNRQSDLRDQFAKGKVNIFDYSEQMRKLVRDAPENGFTKIGVAVTKSNGELRDTRDVLLDVADAFQKMPDGAKKSAAAVQIFGQRNARMTSFLNQGREGIIALEKEAERVAPALSKLQLAVADELGDAFDTMKKAVNSAKDSIFLLFAPAATTLVRAFTEAIVRNREAAFSFAAALADKVTPIVNDFIAVLEGRDADVKNPFVLQLRDGFVEFGNAVRQVVNGIIIPAFKALVATANTLAQALNGIFGTNITGQTILLGAAVAKLIGLFAVLRAGVSVVVSAVGLLVATFGALPVILAAIAIAIGFFAVRAVGGLKGIQTAWNKVWAAISAFVRRELNGIQVIAGAVATFLTNVWTGVVTAVQTAASAVASAFVTTFNAITTAAQTVVTNIASFFTALPSLIATAFNGLGTLLATAFNGVVQAAIQVGSAILTTFQTVIQGVVTFFNGLPAVLAAPFQAVADLASQTWNAIVQAAVNVGTGIVNAFNSALTAVGSFFRNMFDGAVSLLNQLLDLANKVANAVKAAFGASGGAGRKDGGAVGFAGGGPVHGPGSSRSDSIPAWLSNGEFVQRVAAVRKYGVDFMAALNRGLISPDLVRGLMAGLNGVAMNMSAIMPAGPRFADGGLAVAGGGGLSAANIHFPGGVSFPVQATGDVIDSMQRFASSRALRSAGRKPTWFQG